MSQRSVAQLIKRQVIHLAPSASVREATKLMSENHIGALLVMDEGRLVGIFTERDALNRVDFPYVILKDGGAAAHVDLHGLPVGSEPWSTPVWLIKCWCPGGGADGGRRGKLW